LSTIHREWAALFSLPFYDLADDVLKPELPELPKFSDAAIQRSMRTYRVNEPQAAAIMGAVQTQGFMLIQGSVVPRLDFFRLVPGLIPRSFLRPPGTGKTKTILGLVGAIAGRPTGGTDPFQSTASQGKILLCAPSNAAVDEVAKRLKEGVRSSTGELYVPKVVRIGSDNAINISVRDIFIDELIDKELSGDKTSNSTSGISAIVATLRSEIEDLKAKRAEKQFELSNVVNNSALEASLSVEVRELRRSIMDRSSRLEEQRDRQTASHRAMDVAKRKARIKVLSEADVICATLSGSGHDYMSQLPFGFDTVIIDEAAQCVELSSLIPLRYGCQRCIMVGGLCFSLWRCGFLLSTCN
jgi:senataxin